MADYFLSDLVETTALVNTDLLHIRTVGNIDKKVQFLNLVKTFRDILNKNANYTIQDTDRNPIILVDSTTGTKTITLPTLAANQNKMIWIVKLVAANNVIVDGEGGETINGVANYTLVNQYEVLKVIGVSTTWNIEGKGGIRAADIDFGIAAGDVDADIIPLGTTVTSSPTGGTATNLATTDFVRAAIQEAFNRLIDLSGVENGAIDTRHLGALQVIAAKLATDAVETAKIKNLNVTAPKLATDSVETLKIKARNVTFPKIVAGALDTYFKAQGAGVDSIYEKLALRDTGVKIGNGTRSTAGDEVITGVGFKSSIVFFIATDDVNDNLSYSWGFDDGTVHIAMCILYDATQNDYILTDSIAIYHAVANILTGHITTLSADGFTITWVLTGTCACKYIYLALP